MGISRKDSDCIRTMTELGKFTIRAEKPIERIDRFIPIRSTFSAVNRTLIS